MLTDKKYLAYGSSITSNSITFHPLLSYPSLIAKEYGYDLQNIGFPGSCRMEKEVADFIANEVTFDFATIELGINIIDDMPLDEFYKRSYYLLDQVSLKHRNNLIFVLDIFNYFNEMCGVNEQKLSNYRNTIKRITKELNRDNIIYISAKTLLKSRMNLCGDLVHPDIDGHLEIYNNLTKKLKNI